MNDTAFQLLDFAETPLFVLEPDKLNRPVYVAFNAHARAAVNLTSDEILGKTASELYPGGLGLIAYAHHCEGLGTGQPTTYTLTLPIGGQNRLIKTHLKPILDVQGRVTALVGTSYDITAEHGVKEAQANSVVLNTELEEFVNFAAHDLRSPIRNVRTLTEMLREILPVLNDEQNRLLDKLELVADKAMSLISDVLSHAQATGSPESNEQFELSALCREVMQMLDPHDKHSLVAKPCFLVGDKVATQIILRNLVDNALKHNCDNTIRLTVMSKAEGEQHYRIIVSDNGVGFADPALVFLESKKFRVDSGFGMLGISRLVKSRGGSVSARNASSGKGAIVDLVLPGRVETTSQTHCVQ